MKKTFKTSGADENTPSVPQYFSWINNTNEGSTQTQTLINLEYFKWLKKEYGMSLKLYAWDAGNLDGSCGTYAALNKEKLSRQYPNGYGPIASSAAQAGIRLGVWCGADGFGDTPSEQAARQELLISLCRDYNFMEFKVDSVCDWLREDKQSVFAQTIQKCRKYCPDLILLNHRNNLGPAELYSTTFLWEGAETYIDILMANNRTAPHHRACTLERGLVPELKRLSEDHGVCLSSCLDFFEDELILQAFSRALILAPEIYGNPWLLRDNEQARLARIFCLQNRYAHLLTRGIVLPESYGLYPVSRGDGRTRLLTLRNLSWENCETVIKLDSEIGLDKCEKVAALIHHPYEQCLGTYDYGEIIRINIPPFRSVLFAAVEQERFNAEYLMLTNCAYEIICDKDDRLEINILKTLSSDISFTGKASSKLSVSPPIMDMTLKPPMFLGELQPCPYPSDAQALYEAACFSASSDCLEAQSLSRAGDTSFPAVQAAREAFFNQAVYKARGCESRAMFDENETTFFDALSRYYGTRISGGCLRIDFNEITAADTIEIDYFEIDKPIREVLAQDFPDICEHSEDMAHWFNGRLTDKKIIKNPFCAPVVIHSVHNIQAHCGRLMRAVYQINNSLRYFRLASPMDRIYAVRLKKNGQTVSSAKSRANNMLAHYDRTEFAFAQVGTFNAGRFRPGSYLAIAAEGIHGAEGIYCAARVNGVLTGFDDRAPSFPVNHWESPVTSRDRNYTYYLHLTPEMQDSKITVYALSKSQCAPCRIYLCDSTLPADGVHLNINKASIS